MARHRFLNHIFVKFFAAVCRAVIFVDSSLGPFERSHEIELLLHDLPRPERERLWRLARKNAKGKGKGYAGLVAGFAAGLPVFFLPYGLYAHLFGGVLAMLAAIVGSVVGTRIFCQSGAKDYLSNQLALLGYCPACGYSLNDNTSGTCPECGTRVELRISNATAPRSITVEES